MIKALLKDGISPLRLIILIGLITLSLSSYAQFYSGLQQEFGKNRIQYQDDRTWSYFRYKQFDTYFYQGGLPLAIYSSSYITQEIEAITRKLDYALQQKVRFIIFNSLADLKESNIGLITEQQYNTGGVTHVIDNKIFVYFNGNHSDFERQLREGIGQVVLNNLLYGGSTGAKVKSSILLSFPKWYTDGLVSYLANDWNTEIDNTIRDGILSGKYKKFARLSGEQQIYVGHSIWRYIEQRYGKRAVSEIIYMAKVNRSIESGYLYVLGMTYKMLITDWYEWYENIYNRDTGNEIILPEVSILKKKKNKSKRVYQRPALSPDGRYIAYIRNEIGKVKVRVMNLEKNRRKTIMKFGYKLDEKTDYSYPLVAWSPIDHFLSVIHDRKGKTEMITYNLDGGRPQKRYLLQFEKILDFSYNDRGNMMVMSAVKDGQSDIYLYFIGSNTFKRITYDIYDDEFPRFVNNSSAIVFSSNRKDETIVFDKKTNKNVIIDTLKGERKRDIFFYEIKKDNRKLRRVTNTPLFDETYPMPVGTNQFSWLSDENGVSNRYVGYFDSTISFVDTTTHYRYFTKYHAASNYSFNILEQDYNTQAGKYTELVYSEGHYRMYVHDLPDFEDYEHYKLPATTYMGKIIKAENLRKRKIEEARKRAIWLKNHPEEAKQDSIDNAKKKPLKKKQFRIIYIGENKNKNKSDIDINNYTFNGDNKTKESDNSTNDSYINSQEAIDLKAKTNTDLYKSKLYYVEYSVSNIVTQIDFSSLNYSYQPFTNPKSPIYINPGFSGFIKLGVMDLFEDYRLTGGVRLSYNLKNNEYFASFKNLKKRLDKEVIFHRKVLTENQYDYGVNHMLHEGILRLSWPFDVVKSIRGSLLMRYDNAAYTSINPYTANAALKKPNDLLFNAGLSLSYVYDNTRSPGLNLFYGTRYKLFAEYYQPINNLNQNLFVVGLDYRKYIKLFKTFIWANRLAASTSFGTERLIYYMGSVDNWLFPQFNRNIQVDNSQNFTYQTLATNMRGFNQNIRNGNSFIAINSELRLPPFQFFSHIPLKSPFLQNFMIVGFFDVGTAWSGPNPFSDNNALFKQEIYQQPIKVTIINQNDPIVAGYGFGVRSKLFGYYVRADWAWGIENGRVRKHSIFYLSFSLDF
jgi:hypothetical protein